MKITLDTMRWKSPWICREPPCLQTFENKNTILTALVAVLNFEEIQSASASVV